MTATKTPTFIEAIKTASEVASDLSYQPSDAERQLKAQFIVAMDENPGLADWDNVTGAMVAQLTGDSRIHKLWSKPGFKDWFLNKHEFRAKSEYILNKLLDSFLLIAISEDPKSFSSKVAAAKVLAEIAGRTKQPKVQVLDDEIPSDPEELKAYIEKLEGKKKK